MVATELLPCEVRYINWHFTRRPQIRCLKKKWPVWLGDLVYLRWSFMLALRERGLGSAWTTLHLLGEGEREAADILGIPFETHSQVGLFPVAYTVGTDFKPAKRPPAEEFIRWNDWS